MECALGSLDGSDDSLFSDREVREIEGRVGEKEISCDFFFFFFLQG